MPAKYTPDRREALFWPQVEKTPNCWLWTGPVNNGGYGSFWSDYGNSAHRYAYSLAYGAPGSGHVLHRCDVRRCCNPDHLFLGNASINALDCRDKGRMNIEARKHVGSAHGMAKLAETDIPFIRESPRLCREIAVDYGVSMTLIAMIRRRTIWTHAP